METGLSPSSETRTHGELPWRKADTMRGANIVSRTLVAAEYGRTVAEHPNLRAADGKFVLQSGTPLSVDAGDPTNTQEVFPTKRTTVVGAHTNADVVYLVKDGRPFNVGDEIDSASGTQRAITAIAFTGDDWEANLTVGTTLGDALDDGEEIWTPNKDVAIGILNAPVDLTDTGAGNVIVPVVIGNCSVWEDIINLIAKYTTGIKGDLAGVAGTKLGKNITFLAGTAHADINTEV